MLNKWKQAARYAELIECYIIDTGAGYTVIRKWDGASKFFPYGITMEADIKDWMFETE